MVFFVNEISQIPELFKQIMKDQQKQQNLTLLDYLYFYEIYDEKIPVRIILVTVIRNIEVVENVLTIRANTL